MKPTPFFKQNRDWVWGLLLFTATFIVYQPAWNGQPLWDDEVHMTPHELRSWDGLRQIWTQPRGTVQYFPLAHTVFWVEARLFGDATLGYHLINILLHCISALLLVGILRKLGISGAWFAAAAFALHPVMVESVAWISELKNMLSGVFFLAAAFTYLAFTEKGGKRWYVAALTFFLCGLLSKTGVALFPAAMLAVVWWKHGRLLWKRDIVPLLPFFLVGFIFGLITIHVERNFIGTRGTQYEFTLIESTLIAGRALWFYLGKIFFPVNLMISYPRRVPNTALWWQYLFPAAALLLSGGLWALRRKLSRAPAAVFFYFTAMLLPYLGFFSLFAFRYSFVADHYQYLAAIGPIVLGTGLIDKAAGSMPGNRTILKPVITVTLLLTFGILSRNQSRMYADAGTLYRTTIERNRNSWMAHNNLGLLLANSRRTGEAAAHYRKALELNPDYTEALNNLGLLLLETGKSDEAMGYLSRAVKINPGYGSAQFNLGRLLAGRGQTGEALFHYRKALEINPDHTRTRNNMGLLLSAAGRYDEAIEQYRKALEINPGFAEVHYNLANLLAGTGRPDEALAHLQKVVALQPGFAEAYNNIGILLAQKGQTDAAMAHFVRAVKINPNYDDAYCKLGYLLEMKGQSNEAAVYYRRALQSNPANSEARGSLDRLLAKNRNN